MLTSVARREILALVHAARLRAGQRRVVHPPGCRRHRGRFACLDAFGGTANSRFALALP